MIIFNPSRIFTLSYIGNEEVFQINVMAVSYGKLEEFDTANSDDWVQYIECMEHYFLANKITDPLKQRLILISSMEQKAYKILRNIVTPNTLTNVIGFSDDQPF